MFFFLSFVRFWECFGFVVVVISKKFPQIRLHSASLSMLGTRFDEILTVILLIADSFILFTETKPRANVESPPVSSVK